MNEQTLPPPSASAAPKKQGALRLSGMIAAVLVCVILVGSMVLVLGAAQGISALLGSRHTAPTQRVNPATCKDDSLNPAEEQLCVEGKETALNITKNFKVHTHDQHGNINGTTTLNITFQRAYADVSQLLLVYTINQAPAVVPDNDWGSFNMLITDQGQLNSYESTMMGFIAQPFDTSSLPTGVTQLHVQAIQTGFGELLPLDFTLPLHTANHIVMVKQTVTGHGYTLALNHLTFTESATILTCLDVFPSPSSLSGTSPNIDIQSLTINGKLQTIVSGGDMWNGNTDTGNGNGSGIGTITLNQSLLNQPGTWTITLVLTDTQSNKTLLTANFTFTVPASA